MLKSVFSQGKGQVVKTCVTFKSMEMTLLVRVVFFVSVFQIAYAMSMRGINGIMIM